MQARRKYAICAVSALVALSACSTTYSPNASTTTVTTTTTIPTGTSSELFANIFKAVTGLSNAIAKDSGDAKDRLDYINANWKVLQGDLSALTDDDREPMVRLMRLVNTAVNRKRPADADKVQKFLPAVIDSLLAKL